MHFNTFDRYESRHSVIHRLDPRVKVVVTVLFIVANALLPDGAWLAFLAAWALLLFVSGAAQIGLGTLLKRSLIVVPFLLAAVTVIFTLPGNALTQWQLGSWTITPTDAGLLRFVSIVIRSWLSVQMAILLTATTQFPDLIHALHHLRVPNILVSVISFMYRYLFELANEAGRLLRARESRSAAPMGPNGRSASGGSLLWRAKIAGHMVGQLLLRSFERSDRVYNAMVARGYNGRLLTMNPHEMRPSDWRLGGLGVVAILLIQLVARL